MAVFRVVCCRNARRFGRLARWFIAALLGKTGGSKVLPHGLNEILTNEPSSWHTNARAPDLLFLCREANLKSAFVFQLTACIVLAASLAAARGQQKQQPNLIVILADDLGAKELGCYGNTDHRTPNLDRLATTGVKFETCFTSPVCHPTRF